MMSGRRLSLPIETERVELREFVPTDLEAMHAYACLEEVTRYLMWGPNDLKASEVQLSTFIDAAVSLPRLIYELALTSKPDGHLIGALCLYQEDVSDGDRRGAELGFVLHPDFWGKGLVSEAATVLLDRGMADLGLDYVWATCDTRNLASVRVLEKIGMMREETILGTRKTSDGLLDEHRYVTSAR